MIEETETMPSYTKEIITHSIFYIVKFSKVINNEYLIFIHGGPGLNCGIVEFLIENEKLFDTLDYNIILYDQRGCGRSSSPSQENVNHIDNMSDLNEIYLFLIDIQKLNIKGFIGHSYGAKLLFDFYKEFKVNIPGIFVSTAESVLTPRLNNLMLDLNFLKKTDENKYQEILQSMDNLTLENLWALTEALNPLSQLNKDRLLTYWANIDFFNKVKKIQIEINLPIKNDVFMSVRKDLYSNSENFSVDIKSLPVKHLWINGFHDQIMNGQNDFFSNSQKVTFFKSAHYPHIEENESFCEQVNVFLKNNI